MKKLMFVTILVLVVAAGCVCAFAAVRGKSVRGSGTLITKNMTVGAFDAVEASRAVKVVIAERPQGDVLIEADDNLMEYVKVKVSDKTLEIGFVKEVGNISDYHVTVTVPADPAIGSLEASSASKICSTVPLVAPDVKLEASSAARIEAVVQSAKCSMDASSAARIVADVVAGDCRIEASSAAKIELKGKAKTCQVDMSSASKLDASDFVVGEYSLQLSSAANASVNCLATLNADVSSGAKVSYKGDCGGVRNVSSGGRVVME